jgi:GDP-mannose pyrophosphatase NudK
LSRQRYSVRHERNVYRGFIKVDIYEAEVADGSRTATVRREVHDHGHGVALLPYDAARGTCLLIRQLRLPVHVAGDDGLLIETAAGLIDPTDASPADAARREAAEELRFHVDELEPVGMVYALPGLVTEQMHLFLARYSAGGRISEGFEPDEDEMIDVEEWSLAGAWAAWEANTIRDAKTVLLLQALRLRRPELFSR